MHRAVSSAFLALLSAGPALILSANAAAASPVAYVYVQTSKGVEVFSAASNGQLTKVSGSPFADTGQMGAINGSYMIAVGTENVRTYAIESNGGIGKQVSEIDAGSYGGGQCGPNQGGALFDHTGKYLYLLTSGSNNPEEPCSALQTYKIASSGDLTFLGDSENTNSYHGSDLAYGVSTISGSDTFGFGVTGDIYTNEYSAFSRNSNGEFVENAKFTTTGPTPNPAGTNNEDNYWPNAVAADPSNHLAAVVFEYFAQNPPPPQLASYTINSNGSITSTNTWENMPTPAIYPNVISMSPSGTQLAVAGKGIEIYNFNGASPMTLAASLPISARDFGFLSWDKNNHLYAVDYETGDLYVYTIGSKTITAVSGSPYTIPGNTNTTNQYDLIVVPK